MPWEERDLFKLDLVLVIFRDFDPNNTGLLFRESWLEKPDLASLMDTITEVVRSRVFLKIEQVHSFHIFQTID